MNWIDFENNLVNEHIHVINNNSNKNIVLFGSCHMATIGYMLNNILNYKENKNKYNIYIIISWIFENKGIEKFDMVNINNRITDIVSNCDIFIYHAHITDYSVNATKLPSIVKNGCLKFIIPNYRLDYTSDHNNYSKSLDILKYHISNSSFPEFMFLVENHKNIMFFNTTNHPTHYVLFLQTEALINRILNNGEKMNIHCYFSQENRNYFKQISNYIILPGRNVVDKTISNNTGINVNADYFD
jgi:hypothetical protein